MGVLRFLIPVLLAAMVSGSTETPIESYLQFGADAARTGIVHGHGPLTNDIAFQLKLDGSRSGYSTPLIIGRNAYVVTSEMGAKDWKYVDEKNLKQNAVWKISLDAPTKDPEPIWRFNPGPPLVGLANGLAAGLRPPASFAADEKNLYLVLSSGIWAADHEGQNQRLLWPMDQLLAEVDGSTCADPAIEEGVMYMACFQLGRAAEGVERSSNDVALFAVAVDLQTGTRIWRVEKDIQALTPVGESTFDACGDGTVKRCTTRVFHIPSNAVKVGDVVAFISFVAWNPPPAPGTTSAPTTTRFISDGEFANWTIVDARDGNVLWTHARANPELKQPVEEYSASCKVTGDKERMFLRSDSLLTFNPRNKNSLWTPITAEKGHILDVENCAGFAYDGRYVWSSWLHMLERFDTRTGVRVPFSIPHAEVETQTWSVSPFLIADGVLYGRSTKRAPNPDIATEHWIRAIDTETGAQLWERYFHQDFATPYPRGFEFGVASGVVVVAGYDGTVTVIGETGASLRAAAKASTLYPAVGASFSVDMGDTEPGAFGPATDFSADWGDGTSTPWQTSPRLNHTYAGAAPAAGYQARLLARNVDGQEHSTFLGFHPGGTPPKEPSLIAKAVSRENLPFTLLFLVFGIAAAGGLALVQMRRRVGAQDRRLEQVSRLLSTRDAQRYQLVRELGRGTFGTAHLARDTRLERLVVLKQPRAAWALGAEGRQAFLQEARLAAKVHHANVVTVLEVLPESDPPVLVMEYVEGGSLEEQMGRGPLPLAQACYIVADVLEGLQAIHESGIVHRDLKPGNVLLDDRGRAKVGDFGIAGPPTAAPEVAPTWGAMTPGSLAYMSPEQINGDAVGPASDLHAAGILLHELLAGQRPYRASRPEELWREIAAGRTHVGRSVPARLRPFLAGLLAKDPSKRPASAAQAADQLRALAAQPESRRAVG